MPDKCKKRNAERARKWRQDNPDYTVRYHATFRRSVLKKYNMTSEDYDELFRKQKGLCAICDLDDLGRFKYFCVDHCHTTGLVRGLLCHTCNRALGLFKDNVEHLKRAAEYLKEYK